MSQAPTTTKPMTAEEFFDFVHQPENADRWFELVRGEVIELPPPTKPHGVSSSLINYHLTGYAFSQGRFYVTGNDTGVILKGVTETVRGPDVAVYNDATSYSELHPKYGEVPPLLAVEILSPNDRHVRVMDKIADYLKAGVRLVWILDPEMRQVWIHQPNQSPHCCKQDEEITGEDVLPGFRGRVSDFFRLPGEKPAGS